MLLRSTMLFVILHAQKNQKKKSFRKTDELLSQASGFPTAFSKDPNTGVSRGFKFVPADPYSGTRKTQIQEAQAMCSLDDGVRTDIEGRIRSKILYKFTKRPSKERPRDVTRGI